MLGLVLGLGPIFLGGNCHGSRRITPEENCPPPPTTPNLTITQTLALTDDNVNKNRIKISFIKKEYALTLNSEKLNISYIFYC